LPIRALPDFLRGGFELHAAFDVLQVFQHQTLGARGVAAGDGLNEL
jgi:hypothetical protein